MSLRQVYQQRDGVQIFQGKYLSGQRDGGPNISRKIFVGQRDGGPNISREIFAGRVKNIPWGLGHCMQ